MTVQVQPARSLLQQARLAQWLTVGWMVIEGAVAIGAGIVAHSVALTAFGVDSGIELFSSVVVLRRLLQRSESEERGSMTGGERGATKLVGFALYGLIAYIILSAGVALAGLLLNQFFGLWWADPLAGLALIWWIRGEANEALEASKVESD